MLDIINRVKNKLSVMPYVEERKIPHGIGFLLRGAFFIGVWKDSLMVKLSHKDIVEILSMPFVTIFNEIDKVYIPNVALVGPQGIERDEHLDYWITRAALHVEMKEMRRKTHHGQPPTILDLASPPEESDLSATETSLLECEQATAKLVRLREGQIFNLQTRSQPAMLFVAEGEATFQAVDNQSPAKTGIWCFLPPYCQLAVTAKSVSAIVVVVLT
ncbi:MAG: hypothetical protein ACKO38_03505 [Planctomycetota bacterium]